MVDISAHASEPSEPEAEHTRELTEATKHAPLPERTGPRSIGGYKVGPRIGEAGACEIYFGERTTSRGIVRRAVVKRVAKWRPDYERWRDVLLDEAMVTACFAHPNLASLVDVGESSSGAFIALEQVDGTNLEKLATALRVRHLALPLELACFVIAEALRGMHYAHTLRGPDGRELGVVLRDRTPANLLISRTGHVKLTDFALAVMSTRRQQSTDAGVVKGTYAYLAPEYISGDPCSVRSDIYSLGVMLFELLAGRECFPAESAYDVLSQIVGRGVAWRELEREGVPAELMEIVARATNPCAGGRYESAEEMVDAIEHWLVGSGRPASAELLARTLSKHELFGTAGEDSTMEERRYVPALRIVRGASVVVTEAPSRAETPPPVPEISLVPIAVAVGREESALDDAFEDRGSKVIEQELIGRPELKPRGAWTQSEIEGLFTDDVERESKPPRAASGELDRIEIVEAPDEPEVIQLQVNKRPPISAPVSVIEERIAIHTDRSDGGVRVMVIAAIIAVLMFVAILYFPT